MVKKKIKITIKTLEESFKEDKEFASELDRGIFKKQIPELNFESFNTYKKMLTEKRLELLQTIKSKNPENIKKLAKISNRDFKNVYEDVKILEGLGLIKLKKGPSGLIPIVIYDEIDIDIKIPLKAISK